MRIVLIHLGFLVYLFTLSSCPPYPDKARISEQSSGTWSIEMGSARLLVDPNDGARDISLLIEDTEYITGKDIRKDYYGSSLWISPENRSWPQTRAPDFGVYSVSPVENGIHCTSRTDEANGLVYQKMITADVMKQAFVHLYTIINESDSNLLLAAWEVTRHHKKGISLFPLGDTTAPGTRYLDASIPMTLSEGMVWHEYDLSQKGHPVRSSKAILDGRDGWIAYVFEGYAVVKVFEDVDPMNIMQGDQDVEIYVDSGYDYIEIEVLSEKTELAPGESLEWKVEWKILHIPADMDISPGSQELPAFIQSSL